MIRALGLANAGRREHQADATEEFEARRQAVAVASERLDKLAAARALPESVVAPLRAGLQDRLNNLEHRIDGHDSHRRLVELYDDIELTLIAAERQLVNDLYRDGKLKDEARRRIERELDLREAGLETGAPCSDRSPQRPGCDILNILSCNINLLKCNSLPIIDRFFKARAHNGCGILASGDRAPAAMAGRRISARGTAHCII